MDPHVVLIRGGHAPIGNVTVPSEAEQRYRAQRWVELHVEPLFLRELFRLVQHLYGDAGLPDVVEK